MEGMARARLRESDLAMSTAWHTAMFALSGYAGKLKGKKLSDFLSSQDEPQPELKNAQVIHFFHSLKAKGVPIEITRH